MNDIDYIRKQDPFSDIIEEHVSEISGLWECRASAVKQSNQQLPSLLKLDHRIEKHIAALRLDADASWAFALEALSDFCGPGEAFVAAILGFSGGEGFRIRRVLNVSREDPAAFKGVVSAMGWLPTETIRPWLQRWLLSNDMDDKYLAVAACSVQRLHPGDELRHILLRSACRDHVPLYSRALRLIGELKCVDFKAQLTDIGNECLKDDGIDDSIAFWSSWSAAVLGEEPTDDCLEQYIVADNPYQHIGVDNFFRCLSNDRSREWIELLADACPRRAVGASAALGDPQAIDWLIEMMHDAKLARLAGAAFSMITGVDLDREKLGLVQLCEASEVDEASFDEDSLLDWPDPNKVAEYWQSHCGDYQFGHRYLLGNKIEAMHLHAALPGAYQKQRRAIAFELARCGATDTILNMSARLSRLQ